ncbi:MAG: arginine--tRNA ligase [Coriobacteriales bacterium]|nr:arginine--tRNA ligase [Coriobacteriales bacterium]
MRSTIESIIAQAMQHAAEAGELNLSVAPDKLVADAVERPRDPSHGDWASTIALKLARELKTNPRELATTIAAHIAKHSDIDTVEVAGAGFINIRLAASALHNVIREANEQGENFARSDVGKGRTINVEFISANPTGPMHVGHGRWAALGNALCNLLEHAGWQVTREFYINDAGTQMEKFGHSIVLRYLELLGEDITMPDDCYGGTYIIDIARHILKEDGEKWRTFANYQAELGECGDADACAMADWDIESRREEYFRERGYQLMLAHMQDVCERVGVRFDVWFSERSLYRRSRVGELDGELSAFKSKLDDKRDAACGELDGVLDGVLGSELRCELDGGRSGELDGGRSVETAAEQAKSPIQAITAESESPIQAMLSCLQQGGYLYEQDGATWFRSTLFGDDKDRVLIKADGSFTYFAPDIAYHRDKFERTCIDAKDLSDSKDPSAASVAQGTSGYTGRQTGGSEFLIDIWGADHHGYIPRMQAAMTALGHEGKLTIVLGQLVNLYRNGEVVRMSKRTGEMVTFEELIEEVGADATKYLMLSRSTDQPIDFDIELAKKQDASNPVYYVQYAHARICSLMHKAADAGLSCALTAATAEAAGASQAAIDPQAAGTSQAATAEAAGALQDANSPDLSGLVAAAELDLAREIARFPEVVEAAARDLAPFRLTHYAQELATAFHSFYTQCPVLSIASDEPVLACARLYLASATRSVLALALSLLGVLAPKKM